MAGLSSLPVSQGVSPENDQLSVLQKNLPVFDEQSHCWKLRLFIASGSYCKVLLKASLYHGQWLLLQGALCAQLWNVSLFKWRKPLLKASLFHDQWLLQGALFVLTQVWRYVQTMSPSFSTMSTCFWNWTWQPCNGEGWPSWSSEKDLRNTIRKHCTQRGTSV